MLPIACEWNIDLASENLGSCAARDENGTTGELGENEMTYCKYESELTYMYEPDVLDTLPPTMCALYGSETETTLQGTAETYPIMMTDESHTEKEIKQEEWSERQPASPSHDSVDSSWESQVSTPQASPRRCEADAAPAACVAKSSTRVKAEKVSIKDRKKEVKATETRSKQQRASAAKPAPVEPADDDDDDDDDLAEASSSRSTSSRNRSVTPAPEDDPEGLFARDPSTLTPEEIKLLKKKKRLIKNRESAQLSRQRKRVRLETLQAEVHHLEDENKALNSKVEMLMEENAALKRKLAGPGKTRASAAAAH